MPPRSVLVTYTLHPTPSSPAAPSSPLHSALSGIRSHFPLRNLHWKSSTRTALRTIQEVDVSLVELGEVPTFGKEVAGSVLEYPLVNLCVVSCENDEVYKAQTRSFIRDWLSLLGAKRNVHVPLIVLVNTAASTTSSGKNVFGRDKGIIGKLRSDFNTGKRDRCVQVTLPAEGTQDPAAWIEILNKLKESIVQAFDGAIIEREDEVKRGEAQRMTIGWNFCTWFLLKESLAHSFEGVNLHEDALIVYEELEATFFQVLKEQNLSWFGKLGATGPRDDSLPILDTTAKPYRDLLKTSSISIFDFRIYLFARQGALLGRLGRITEIAKRGQWFVASLTRRLRENEADLAEHFIESWTYTACMDIVSKCDEWSRLDRPNGDYTGLIAYESARSELLDIARVQVERVGVVSGHLPNSYPFSPPSSLVPSSDDVLFESSDNGLSDSEESGQPVARPRVSNSQLLDAMSDDSKFKGLYLNLTKKAINAYEACGKTNAIVRLRADVTALALHGQDWQVAFDLSCDLARLCADLNVWDPVARFALEAALQAHTKIRRERDQVWVDLALAYLRARATGAVGDAQSEEGLDTLTAVLEDLKTVQSDVTTIEHRAFSVRLLRERADRDEALDSTTIQMEIINHLPVNVSVSGFRATLEDHSGAQIDYTAGSTKLPVGTSLLKLTTTTSVQGLFTLRSSMVILGSIFFEYAYLDGFRIIVRQSPDCVRTMLRMPYKIALDNDQQIVLEVHAGRCELKDASISLISLQNDVRYSLETATIAGRSCVLTESGAILVGNVAGGDAMTVKMSYSGSLQSEVAKARVQVNYRSVDGTERKFIDVQSVAMGLPLTVNVQDFFRPDCLISHFTIASDGREYLRVGDVKLVAGPDDGYEVEEGRRHDGNTAIVGPQQPLSSLFKVRRRNNTKGIEAVFRLVIQYRTLDEEVGLLADAALLKLEPTSVSELRRAMQRLREDRSSWLRDYLATSDLTTGISAYLRDRQAEGSKLDSEQVDEYIRHLRTVDSTESSLRWRTLEIPVEVPQRRLLTTAIINPISPSGLIYEGRAISMALRLQTTLNWTAPATLIVEAQMVFDIQANSEDWVILGKKKGFYTPLTEESVDREIVLVPVRSGKLFLPSVQVHLFRPPDASDRPDGEQDDSDGLMCETHVENAGEVVNVLPAKGAGTMFVPIV